MAGEQYFESQSWQRPGQSATYGDSATPPSIAQPGAWLPELRWHLAHAGGDQGRDGLFTQETSFLLPRAFDGVVTLAKAHMEIITSSVQ